jgi:hypothetical protein
MPARHTSLQVMPLLEAAFSPVARSTKEGVGETSGQTAGSSFEEFALRTGPAEETSFLRSVRISGPQFHRAQSPQ